MLQFCILKNSKKCQFFGVSVYSPDQLNMILDLFVPDIVQLPFNVFDQRFLRDGSLSALKKLGVEVHARSIFLQGLLLMRLDDIPAYFSLGKVTFWRGIQMCCNLGALPQHVALSYVLSNKYIDKVVVGIENLRQLIDLASSSIRVDASPI